jgi:hypothetical protein
MIAQTTTEFKPAIPAIPANNIINQMVMAGGFMAGMAAWRVLAGPNQPASAKPLIQWMIGGHGGFGGSKPPSL